MIEYAHTPIRPDLWDSVSGYFQMAVDKTQNKDWMLADMLGWLNQGMGLLLINKDEGKINSAAIVEAIPHHRTLVLRIHVMGAEKHTDWMTNFDELTRWAKAEGYTSITGEGRHAWPRVLEKQGYEVKKITGFEVVL